MDRAHPDRARGAADRTLRPHARGEPGLNDRRPPTPRAPPLGLRGVGADQDPARARTAGAGGLNAPTAPRLLLVTGLSGAGKSSSAEHTSELQSLLRPSYAVLCST